MSKRELVLSWLMSGLDAVDPTPLTRRALDGYSGPATVIAIGKAAPAMCRGAAEAIGSIDGVCVTNQSSPVPDGIELLIGDHPVPGSRSFAAGRRVLEVAPRADLALISGGGSALCELPIPGVDPGYLIEIHHALVDADVPIEEINHVRGQLSAIKCGGLGPLPTFILSDVAGAPPGVVSSGPTIPIDHDAELAIEVLTRLGLEPPEMIKSAMRSAPRSEALPEVVEVIGDGRMAAAATAAAVPLELSTSTIFHRWLEGSVESEVDVLLSVAGSGVTVAAGEPTIGVGGESGRGGRNTHAALLAASALAGTTGVFGALATDGVDGRSGVAGAIVDGDTIARGGDPRRDLQRFDSAGYLETTGDLIETGPTGTNVSDLWLIWAPD